jgi:glutamate--cysteine ligase catalytic subunit
MARGHQRDAITRSVFWFRSDISTDSEDVWREMTIDEILNGGESFGGLVPLIRQYIVDLDLDTVTHDKLTRYVDLVSGRASGELFTTAKYIREYVRKHPAYMMDSFVPQETVYDLIMHANDITKGNVRPCELFGST